MCCFSGPVEFVADTRIFARLADGWQLLAYEMRVGVPAPVAMVLPLPTKPSGRRLEFVDLSGTADLFGRLDADFGTAAQDGGTDGLGVEGGPVLPVARVGHFEASFVPARADFARLDARFRLPDDAWRAMPVYDDWSFAVFQLAAGELHPHPMGLAFETRDPGRLFFPTLHLHDGQIPARARFDHALYVQGQPDEEGWSRSWRRADAVLAERLRDPGIARLCRAGAYFRRREIRGEYPNQDTWVPLWIE